MDLGHFLAQYWSQTTVIIGAIGYALKSFFDYRTKKLELRFAHTMGELSSILTKYTLSYVNLNNTLYDLSRYAEFGNDQHLEQMQYEYDDKVDKSFNEFIQNHHLLEIFADSIQFEPYRLVSSNMAVLVQNIKSTVGKKGHGGLSEENYQLLQQTFAAKIEENTQLLKSGRIIFNKRYLSV